MTDSPDPDPSIEQRINTMLMKSGSGPQPLTLATAESCTGGGVAARLTAITGSSGYFLGGIVAYSNDAKASLLGVSPRTLANPGAVSAACAREMATGARDALGSDFAVSTTGISGPGGATTRKPVGLVYIALATPDRVTVEEFHFPGDRTAVTAAATDAALLMLLHGIAQHPK